MTILAVIRELGCRLAHLDLDWTAAANYAMARKNLVDVDQLRDARIDLGDSWCAEFYRVARAEAQAPEEIVVDDVTEINDSRYHLTVNGLILRLVAMRDANQDVGYMPVGIGPARAPIATVVVEPNREAPVGDADYTLVLK